MVPGFWTPWIDTVKVCFVRLELVELRLRNYTVLTPADIRQSGFSTILLPTRLAQRDELAKTFT